MNLDMYIISQYKKYNKIVGFRLLAIKQDDSIEIRDEEYNKVFAVASNGLIRNLKVENGKLKGVNGSIDRYAVFGKTQALVILKELRDTNGNTLGYLCSDAEGNVRKLTQEQVIMFSDKFSIANGKVVNDTTNNKRYVSSIEGSYDIKSIQPQKSDNQHRNNINLAEQNKQKQPSQQAQAQAQAQQHGLPNLTKEDKELLNKVKNNNKFRGSFAEKIVKTIEEKGYCSFNQRRALLKELHKWENPDETNNKLGMTQEVIDTINELKKYKNFNGSYAEKIVNTINIKKSCSEKQLKYLKEALTKLEENSNKQQSTPVQTQNSSNQTTASLTDTDSKNNDNINSLQTNSNNSSEPSTLKSDSKKLDKIKDSLDKERDEVEKLSEADIVALRQKSMDAKQKRAVDQSIVSDDIFDYAIHKNGTAFIEGFKSGIEIPSDIVVPETITSKGITYSVIGVSNGAFVTENIKSFKASKNIRDIGQYCFSGCNNLETVDLSLAKHTLIPAKMCKDCIKLVNINIGNFVEKIHEYAFYNTGLISLTLPSLTTSVAQYAFAFCKDLVSIAGTIRVVDANAFLNDEKLEEFNFENLTRISTHSFRHCGFTDITLYKDLRSAGSKAFADNLLLRKVTIQEGVEELGEYCFAKVRLNGVSESGEGPIENIDAPRSLKQIGYGAFRNAIQVTGYTGTQAESHCISNGVPFNALDAVNDKNSSASRLISTLLGSNPIETLIDTLENKRPGSSNPDYTIDNKKLLNASLNEQTLMTLGIEHSENNIDPHIKFKAALNYLQDVASDMKLPLTNSVLRLQKAFYINNEVIYDDGCNKICKISYEMVDTLDRGEFIAVTMHNNLVYITDCNVYTNMTMSLDLPTDDRLPLEEYLHVGDIIGDVSTISGHSTMIESNSDDNSQIKSVNVGTLLYDSIMRNSFSVKISNKDRYAYVPCADIALKLHDRTLDDIDENNKINGSSEAILKMMNYKEFIDDIKRVKKQLGGSEKFFENISTMTEGAVNHRINEITTIGIEKEAQLFRVSKQFVDIVLKSGSVPNPNMLTIGIFNELAKSYWMIRKDESWLKATGKKSLNQTAEYNIGECKLTEYKSNQIVKFSNPYMNGKKGAYVYVLTKNSTLLGVYASRYNMHWITEKLFALTHISSNIDISQQIMVEPETFDAIDPDLFYNFYSILENKNGHSFNKIFMTITKFNNEFNISMYKPTGIFYITASRFIATKTKDGESRVIYSTVPILPIGDMNHALLVATTTNSSTRSNKRIQNLLDELTNLSAQLYINQLKSSGSNVYIKSDMTEKLDNTYNRYIEARKLAMQGVTDASKYRELIDDRTVFMMGAVHKGEIQRELDSNGYEFEYEEEIDIDDTNIELDESSEEFELDIEDTNVQDAIDDIELEDTEDDVEIDIDDESEDNEEISFEDFFKTAKSMGITDEQQARAMYINFMNRT